MAAKKKRQPRPKARPSTRRSPTRALLWEALGVAALIFLFIYFLSISWRKWPDPLVDFGRELYLPWRISQGALLYRDVEGHYGPLSQYFNSLLFRCFGPGLMVLVAFNLIVFGGILTFFYLLCRKAWGPRGAFFTSVIFISVFGFSQLTVISNYNYAAPYAHETTHGMLVCLALVFVLCLWVREPTLRRSLLGGLLYGLCIILKPEFMLAGASCGVIALALRWRYHGLPPLRLFLAVLAGALVPTLVFVAYFAAFVPFREAASMAAGAWLPVISSVGQGTITGIQANFSGSEKAGANLVQHLIATGVALLLLGLIGALAWFSIRLNKSVLIAVGLAAIATAVWISSLIDWPEIGHCLLGLILIYAAVQARQVFFLRKLSLDDLEKEGPRMLLAIFGVALMARMALNGRIYQYGFYQAAVAGCIVPAILTAELPERLRLPLWSQRIVIAAAVALFCPGVISIAEKSQPWLRVKTAPVGEGSDRFYTYPRRMEATGELIDAVATELKKEGKIKSLLVVPEGIMINYLARIPSTVPYYFYASTTPHLVAELEADPPERVVLMSRDLREYGIEHYGDSPGGGQEILEWLARDYQRYAHAGGDPLDIYQRGARFFKRKPQP